MSAMVTPLSINAPHTNVSGDFEFRMLLLFFGITGINRMNDLKLARAQAHQQFL
jgi:hypothetical protein